MAGKNLELDVTIGGQLDGSLKSSFGRATKQAQALSKELALIGRAQYKAEKEAAQLRGIQKQIQEYQALSKTLQDTWKSYNASGGATAKNRAAIIEQTNALEKLRASLDAAGYAGLNFKRNQEKLGEELKRNAKLQEDLHKKQNREENYLGAKKNLADTHTNLYNATGNFQTGLDASKTIMSPFTDAVKTAMEFEAEMSKVKAMTQMDNIQLGNWSKVNAEMKMLTEQAKELGMTTQFTSVQAAQAQFYMAKAGWDANKVFAGMPHILNMAAVENMELGRASEIVTNIMSGFGLESNEVGRAVDVLAYTSTHANTDLNSLGETMKYAAPIAKSFGATLEETATMTKFMADAGITGSQAGTSLRQGLLRLVAPPKKASKAMQELGVSLSDAQAEWANANATAKAYGVTLDASKGPGEQLISVIKQIESGMVGASSQEKIAALNAITGINAVSGWAAVMANSTGNIEEFHAKLQNCNGAAAQTAKVIQDNTKGAFTRLNSAVEAVSQNIGEVFLPIVRDVTEEAAVYATALAKWVSQHQDIIKIAGITAAVISGLIMTALTVQVAVATWGMLANTFALVQTGAIRAAGAIMELNLVTKVSAGIASMKKALENLSSSIELATKGQWRLNLAILANPYVLAAAAIIGLLVAISLLIVNFDALKNIATVTFNHISGTVAAWVEKMKLKFDEAAQKLANVWNSITGDSLKGSDVLLSVFNNVAFAVGVIFDVMAGVIGGAVGTVINIFVGLAQIIGGVVNIIAGIISLDWQRIWDGAEQIADGAAGTIVNTIGDLVLNAKSIFDTLSGKSHEVEAEAKKAREALGASGGTKAAEEAQATANALNNAGINAGAMAQGVQQTAQNAGQAKTQIEQLNALMSQTPQNMQASFSQLPTAASQTTDQMAIEFNQLPAKCQPGLDAFVQTSIPQTMAQVPQNMQTVFSGLPPMTAQTTDQMVAEFAKLTAKCQPGADAFIQAANNWGQQAYTNIANWADQMANVVADRLTSAWARVSSMFNAGLNVNVRTTQIATEANVAHNAAGGIYNRGAFLTTFAENSAEAAIPLDGSNRSIDLWQRAGSMLGIESENTSSALPFVGDSGGDVITFTYNAPTINIQGNADNNAVEQIKAEFTAQKRDFEAYVERAIERIAARKRRLSYE